MTVGAETGVSKTPVTTDPIYAAVCKVKLAEDAIEPAIHRLWAVEKRYPYNVRGDDWYRYAHGNYPPIDPKGPADLVAAELEQGVVWTAIQRCYASAAENEAYDPCRFRNRARVLGAE
jgi:hypothetical protein